jgi:hypothetical protein
MNHLKRWGVIYLLLLLFAASLFGQLTSQYAHEVSQARMHGVELDVRDFRQSFYATVFENWQSEWLQLWVQAVFVVGFADKIFKKSQEETDQIKAELRKLHEEVKRQGGL